ncbi:MAG: glycosyltransferase involved in cell wall biosynthesis [Gammaproteobacteria bacterium]|jgi:glycosyltransferase involved in cell wall biosynthesis
MEVIIVDGMSTDDTRQKIQSFSKTHPNLTIRIIDNEKRFIPHALNKGLKASSGDFLIRMDAHSIPSKDYVASCVHALQEGKGDNVGGRWDIQPSNNSYMARAIAVAAAHPIGSGGANYRSGNKASLVDTVPFGAFTRETLNRNGFFNEKLLANEDYEWNARLRAQDGKVWFDPAIRCQYFARKSYRSLSKQYFNYGYWKVFMLQLYPGSIRLRQMVPPFFVLILLLSALLSTLSVLLNWIFFPWLTGIILSAYLVALILGTLLSSDDTPPIRLVPGIILALATMHLSWGSGFWLSMIANKKARPN